jgi:hypothetical protein
MRHSGSKELVSAWLDGDWSVTLGAFFDCWDSKRHVVKAFEVPKEWMRFRSMDWGSASPPMAKILIRALIIGVQLRKLSSSAARSGVAPSSMRLARRPLA